MNKILRPLVAVAMVAAVVASAVLCCCVGKIAQTLSLKNTSTHDCCPDGKSSQHKDDKACSCWSAKADAEASQLSSAVLPSSNSPVWAQPADVSFAHTFQIAFLKTDFGRSPPDHASAVPLYLQFRVLRI